MMNWLFPLANGLTLGRIRFCFFSLAFIFLTRSDYFLYWQSVPSELWKEQGLTFLLTPIHSDIPWKTLYIIWQVALLFSAVGLFTRTSMIVSAALGALLIGHAQSFGYFTRLYMPPLWAMTILAFSRSGDHFSLDSFWRKKSQPPPPLYDPEYGWPILMIRILFCVVFFSAGVSKVSNGGWLWISGETFRNTLLKAWIWNQELKATDTNPISAFLFARPGLCHFLSFITITLELCSPLALFSRRLRTPIILGLLLMQRMVRFTVLVNFDLYLVLYLFWLPHLKVVRQNQPMNTNGNMRYSLGPLTRFIWISFISKWPTRFALKKFALKTYCPFGKSIYGPIERHRLKN